MIFQNHNVLELKSGSSRALIDPQGGRLLLWEVAGRQVIHWPQEADWSQPLKIRGGNPVLFPFVARHMVDGKIGFWKDQAGLVREMPMHGFGRNCLYHGEIKENTCTLTLTDSEGTRAFYPYSFNFQITYTLGPKSLDTQLTTKNLSTTPLPYYAGHHFYFALPHQDRAAWEFAVDSFQQVKQIPDGSIFPQPTSVKPFRLSDPDLIDSLHILSGQGPVLLRNSSTGQSLAIHLNWPGMVPWFSVTSWTEKSDSDFYCLEPWLGLPNAIHHGQGLRQLPAGAQETARCLIDLGKW